MSSSEIIAEIIAAIIEQHQDDEGTMSAEQIHAAAVEIDSYVRCVKSAHHRATEHSPGCPDAEIADMPKEAQCMTSVNC